MKFWQRFKNHQIDNSHDNNIISNKFPGKTNQKSTSKTMKTNSKQKPNTIRPLQISFQKTNKNRTKATSTRMFQRERGILLNIHLSCLSTEIILPLLHTISPIHVQNVYRPGREVAHFVRLSLLISTLAKLRLSFKSWQWQGLLKHRGARRRLSSLCIGVLAGGGLGFSGVFVVADGYFFNYSVSRLMKVVAEDNFLGRFLVRV